MPGASTNASPTSSRGCSPMPVPSNPSSTCSHTDRHHAGAARAAAVLAATAAGLPVYEYPPSRVKQAMVGRGAADKQQVAFMVRARLGLNETPLPDAADALAIALTHFQTHDPRRPLPPDFKALYRFPGGQGGGGWKNPFRRIPFPLTTPATMGLISAESSATPHRARNQHETSIRAPPLLQPLSSRRSASLAPPSSSPPRNRPPSLKWPPPKKSPRWTSAIDGPQNHRQSPHRGHARHPRRPGIFDRHHG